MLIIVLIYFTKIINRNITKQNDTASLLKTGLASLIACIVLKICLPTSDIFTDGLSAKKAINLEFDLNVDFQNTAYGPTTIYIKFSKFYTAKNKLRLKDFYDIPMDEKLLIYRNNYTAWIFGTDVIYNRHKKKYVSLKNRKHLLPKFQDIDVVEVANKMVSKLELCHPDDDTKCIAWIYEMESQLRYVRKIGYAMLIPLLFNFLAALYKWKQYYRNGKTPLYSVIFVIFQVWPQYNLIVIIIRNWTNKKAFESAKHIWEQDLGLLEPMCESVIQVTLELTFNL